MKQIYVIIRKNGLLIYVASLLVALFMSCQGFGYRSIGVADVSKNETIILSKKSNQQSIWSLSIKVKGSIIGSAEVQLILNNEIYKNEKIDGNVNFSWGGDWYSDQAEIRYIADTASSGTITLKYEFADSP